MKLPRYKLAWFQANQQAPAWVVLFRKEIICIKNVSITVQRKGPYAAKWLINHKQEKVQIK